MKGYQAWMQRVIRERIKQEASVIGTSPSVRKGKALAKWKSRRLLIRLWRRCIGFNRKI